MAKTKPTRKKKLAPRPKNSTTTYAMSHFPVYCDNFIITYSTAEPDIQQITPKIVYSHGQLPSATLNELRRLVLTRELDWQYVSIFFDKTEARIAHHFTLKGYTYQEALRRATLAERADVRAYFSKGGEFYDIDRPRWGWVMVPSIQHSLTDELDNIIQYFCGQGILDDHITDLTYQIVALNLILKTPK